MNRKPKGRKKMEQTEGEKEKAEKALLDNVIALLTGGMPAAGVEEFLTGKKGQQSDRARELVAEARRRITLTADYTKDEQLGLAIRRVEEIYAKAMIAKEPKTALQAQKELSKLLSLYTPRKSTAIDRDVDIAGMKKSLELIAAHLLPLGLAPKELPLEEHARLAALHIMRTKDR